MKKFELTEIKNLKKGDVFYVAKDKSKQAITLICDKEYSVKHPLCSFSYILKPDTKVVFLRNSNNPKI